MKKRKVLLTSNLLYILFLVVDILIAFLIIILLEWYLIYYCHFLSGSQKMILIPLIPLSIALINGFFLRILTKKYGLFTTKNPLYKGENSIDEVSTENK